MDKRILLIGLILALLMVPLVVSIAPSLPSISVPSGLIFGTSNGVGLLGEGGGALFPEGAEHPG